MRARNRKDILNQGDYFAISFIGRGDNLEYYKILEKTLSYDGQYSYHVQEVNGRFGTWYDEWSLLSNMIYVFESDLEKKKWLLSRLN